MNTSGYISLGFRRWKEIVSVMLLTALISLLLGFYLTKTNINATVFMSISARQSLNAGENNENVYENIQASDQFSESIQGWFKNPEFTARIEDQASTSIQFTARKQEKQNLIVTYKAETKELAEKIAQSLKNNLQNEIATYNREANSNFQIAIYSIHIKEQTIPPFLFALLGALLGLFLGIFISYSYEYFFNLASYDSQIEEILDKKHLDLLPRGKIKEENINFLAAFLARLNHKHVTLAGVNIKPEKLFIHLKKKLSPKIFSQLFLPADSAKLFPLESDLVIVCQLGKTRLNDLKKIVTLLPKNFHLVIVQ